MSDTAQTPEQLQQAKEYNRISLYCDLADMFIDLVFYIVMAFVVAVTLDRHLRQWVPLENEWLRLAAFFLIMTALHIAVSIPLSFYSGYVIEHRYELSRQSLGRWFSQYAKAIGLSTVFSLLMIEGLFLVIYLTGDWWWLVAVGPFFLVSVVAGQLFPVLIMPLFHKTERLEDESLSGRFSGQLEGTRLTIEGIYRWVLSDDTVKANAALAGLGRTRRVVLADTLLEEFTHDEIEVVFAHEVGHHVHRHVIKMLVLGAVFSVAGFWFCELALSSWVLHVDSATSYSPLPVYGLPMIVLVLSIYSMVTQPLTNAISRHHERQADRHALKNTDLHEAYCSAFSKLATQNKADPDPHPLEVFLFHSHPPIKARLAMAKTTR